MDRVNKISDQVDSVFVFKPILILDHKDCSDFLGVAAIFIRYGMLCCKKYLLVTYCFVQ